jgi:hypothetical protein
MATTAELEDMVGYRLGVAISSSSVPTTTDVQSWLWEAAKKVAKIADPIFLQNLVTELDISGVSSIDITSDTSTVVKTMSLMLNYTGGTLGFRPVEFLSPKNYKIAELGLSAFIKGTAEFPVFSVFDDKVKWYPQSGGVFTDSGSTVSGAHNASVTTITTSDDTVFSADDYIKVGTEVMLVTSNAIGGDDDIEVTRAQLGTTAASYSGGETIYVCQDPDRVKFNYVKEPADSSGLDNIFDEILVDYATMMAKLQDEELADAQVFGQLFEKEFGGGRK